MKTSAIVYAAPNVVELRDIDIPDPDTGELLVESIYTGVSPGTELRNLSGVMANAVFPAVGGYLNVARVIGRGPRTRKTPADDIPDGALVVCGGTSRVNGITRTYGGHVRHGVTDHFFPIPPGVKELDALLTKLCAIAYQGARLARPTPEDRVAVVGLGAIGQLALRVHAAHGARAVGFDLSPERVETARRAGMNAEVITGSLAATASKHLPPGVNGFDVVVDATGAAKVLNDSIALLRDRGWQEPITGPGAVGGVRFVVQGSYPAEIGFEYFPIFMKGASMLFPRDNQHPDMLVSLDLMARGQLAPSDLVSEVASPADAPDVYARLKAGKGGVMTAAFEWARLRR